MMNYVKQIFFGVKKMMLISLVIAICAGTAIPIIADSHSPIYIPIMIAVLAWLLIWILLFFMVASTMKKEQPLEDIMEEKGYCDEWLQKHSEIYPTPDRAEKLRRVDVLTYLERYEEAASLLDSISTIDMNDDRKFEYQNARLDLFLTTGRCAEAIAELDVCRKFMDIYANANPLRGAVYGCNAAVIRALAGDYEDSEHYLKAAEHTILSQKNISPAIVMIAKTMQLYALGFDAQAAEQAAKTRQEIETSPILTKHFQKEQMLKMLLRAKNYAPENRQEIQK